MNILGNPSAKTRQLNAVMASRNTSSPVGEGEEEEDEPPDRKKKCLGKPPEVQPDILYSDVIRKYRGLSPLANLRKFVNICSTIIFAEAGTENSTNLVKTAIKDFYYTVPLHRPTLQSTFRLALKREFWAINTFFETCRYREPEDIARKERFQDFIAILELIGSVLIDAALLQVEKSATNTSQFSMKETNFLSLTSREHLKEVIFDTSGLLTKMTYLSPSGEVIYESPNLFSSL